MGCTLSPQSLTEKTPYRFDYSPSYRIVFLIEASSSRYIASVKLTHSYPTQPSTETSHFLLCDVHNKHTQILCDWTVGAAPSESVWPTWASGRRLRLLGLTLHTMLPFILRPEESFAISEPDPFGEGFANSQGPRPWFFDMDAFIQVITYFLHWGGEISFKYFAFCFKPLSCDMIETQKFASV